MDPQVSPQVQSPTPGPVIPPPGSLPPRKSPPLMLIIAAVILLLLVGGGAYFLGLRQSSEKDTKMVPPTQVTQAQSEVTITTVPTKIISQSPSVSPTKSQVVSIDAKTSKYVNNEYGFSVIFSKNTGESAEIGCDASHYAVRGVEQTQFFEDTATNTIYFAFPHYITFTEKTQSDGTQMTTSCSLHTTTLESIQTLERDKAHVGGGPTYTKYTFAHSSGDADLQKLVTQVFGKGHTLGKKTPTVHSGVVGVEVLYNGGALGAAYTFLSSSLQKTAILGDITQDCMWPTVEGSCGTKVTFADIANDSMGR